MAMKWIKQIWLVLVLGIVVVLAACSSQGSRRDGRHVPPRRDGALIDGIDVSSHQGDINWEKVTANDDIRFAYIKATEGATYQSPHYAYNVREAQRHGLLVGSYHYLSTTSTIRQQYANFVRALSSVPQDLIPMIDVEDRGAWSRSQLIDSLALLADMLEHHYKHRLMIYSTMDFYNQNSSPRTASWPASTSTSTWHASTPTTTCPSCCCDALSGVKSGVKKLKRLRRLHNAQ